MMLLAATWPMQFIRIDPLNARDFEWFELKYPGWYARYGAFWENYAAMSDPAQGQIPISLMGSIPTLCRVCHMPCVFPRPDISTVRIKDFGGRKHAFCSDGCERTFAYEPHRYAMSRTWDEHFDGYSLAEYIEKCGLVRNDGKTLLAQPHLRSDKRWTLDDIRKQQFEIRDPLKDLPSAGPVVVLQ